MPEGFEFTIRNELSIDRRELIIYQHSRKSNHNISYPNAFKTKLEQGNKTEYIHISVSTGPGDFKAGYALELPPWVEFEFQNENKFKFVHHHRRLIIMCPPGPSHFQLRITFPDRPRYRGQGTENQAVVSNGGCFATK